MIVDPLICVWCVCWNEENEVCFFPNNPEVLINVQQWDQKYGIGKDQNRVSIRLLLLC